MSKPFPSPPVHPIALGVAVLTIQNEGEAEPRVIPSVPEVLPPPLIPSQEPSNG